MPYRHTSKCIESGFGDFNRNVLPMEKYRFDVKRETWTVELTTVK